MTLVCKSVNYTREQGMDIRFYWLFSTTQYITSIGLNYNVWGFYLEGV